MEHLKAFLPRDLEFNISLLFSFLCFFLGSQCAKAQQNELLSNEIATLQVRAGDRWRDLPIISLNQGEVVNISFDDLTHEHRRLCYRIEHCERDWSRSSQIFESDYCEGFTEGNTIEDYQQSINTNQLYTHYRLTIPNDRCRLKLSGNYRVTVYDEDNNEDLLRACFMVLNQKVTVRMSLTTNTDIDVNNSHQQLEAEIDYPSMVVSNPLQQFYVIALQNQRWDQAVVAPAPQYIQSTSMCWSHCRDLIFDGGNEYHKFEILDVDRPAMGVERVDWDGKTYHAWLWPDEPRPNYVFDKDADGTYYIRNSDNYENDYSTEYVCVHFSLKAPRSPYPIYLNGNWTQDRFLPQYEMLWNDSTQSYERALWLKQGYYNYQYLQKERDGAFRPVPSQGNYYQTENSYQMLVYFRPIGGRTDELVGYACLENDN